jgi:hypothetical protein
VHSDFQLQNASILRVAMPELGLVAQYVRQFAQPPLDPTEEEVNLLT